MENRSDLGFQKQLISRFGLNSCMIEAATEQSKIFSELQRNNQNHLTVWGGREE